MNNYKEEKYSYRAKETELLSFAIAAHIDDYHRIGIPANER